MRWYLLLGIILAPVVMLVTGCTRLPPAASIPVALVPADYDAIDEAIEARKGHVVLVDSWATWCGPCMVSFPHLVETHRKYADKGLMCISLSMDNEGAGGRVDKEKVLEFLKKQDATFLNFLVLNYSRDAVRFARRLGLEGSIPHMALFDKSGKKVWDSEQKRLSNTDLDKLIEEQLAK